MQLGTHPPSISLHNHKHHIHAAGNSTPPHLPFTYTHTTYMRAGSKPSPASTLALKHTHAPHTCTHTPHTCTHTPHTCSWEMWTSSHLPRGAAHVTMQGAATIARKLSIDFTPALIGFEVCLSHTHIHCISSHRGLRLAYSHTHMCVCVCGVRVRRLLSGSRSVSRIRTYTCVCVSVSHTHIHMCVCECLAYAHTHVCV